MITKLKDLFHEKKKEVNRNHYYVGFLVSVFAFALLSAMFIEPKEEKIELNSAPEVAQIQDMPSKSMPKTVKRREVVPVKELPHLNPRPVNYQSYHGSSLVKEYFNRVNEGDYRTACSMLTKSKCSSHEGSDISPYSSYFERME